MRYRALCPHCGRRIPRRTLWRSATRCAQCRGTFRPRPGVEDGLVDAASRIGLAVPCAGLLIALFAAGSVAIALATAGGLLVLCLASIWLSQPYLMEHEPAESVPCPVCGYDLRATPDRCPECGAIASSALQ